MLWESRILRPETLENTKFSPHPTPCPCDMANSWAVKIPGSEHYGQWTLRAVKIMGTEHYGQWTVLMKTNTFPYTNNIGWLNYLTSRYLILLDRIIWRRSIWRRDILLFDRIIWRRDILYYLIELFDVAISYYLIELFDVAISYYLIELFDVEVFDVVISCYLIELFDVANVWIRGEVRLQSWNLCVSAAGGR